MEGEWQPQYIELTPSEERLAETVMKLERQIFKFKTPHPLELGRYVESCWKNPSDVSHQIAEELRNKI